MTLRRLAVIGSSGSGKTWLAARLAAALDLPHIELDAIQHGPDWTQTPDVEMREQVDRACPASGSWVADGNYESKGGAAVRERADTVVWIDLERRLVMRQLIVRTVCRVVLRQELWNGNRESLRDALSTDPERSVIRWSWTHHDELRRRYAAQADARWIRLRTHREVTEFLSRIEDATAPRPAADPVD